MAAFIFRVFVLHLSVYQILTDTHKIQERALQKWHEKSQMVEKWKDSFLKNCDFDEADDLLDLINLIITAYLHECSHIILYDRHYDDSNILRKLLNNYPYPVINVQINNKYRTKNTLHTSFAGNGCKHYILFLIDTLKCNDILGNQISTNNKIIIITNSTQWRINEYLENDISRIYENILIISKSAKLLSHQKVRYIILTIFMSLINIYQTCFYGVNTSSICIRT